MCCIPVCGVTNTQPHDAWSRGTTVQLVKELDELVENVSRVSEDIFIAHKLEVINSNNAEPNIRLQRRIDLNFLYLPEKCLAIFNATGHHSVGHMLWDQRRRIGLLETFEAVTSLVRQHAKELCTRVPASDGVLPLLALGSANCPWRWQQPSYLYMKVITVQPSSNVMSSCASFTNLCSWQSCPDEKEDVLFAYNRVKTEKFGKEPLLTFCCPSRFCWRTEKKDSWNVPHKEKNGEMKQFCSK